MKRWLPLAVVGMMLAGVLTGCGSNNAAQSATNGQANNSSGGQQQNKGNGQHNGGNGQRMNPTQQFQDAGASEEDAQKLASLLREDHVQPKWIVDQLQSGRKASDIEQDIQDGKAPKMQPRSNGQNGKNWSGQGGSGSNSGQASNSDKPSGTNS